MPRNQSTVHFLKDLRDRLEMASSYATSHAEKAQQRYVERYNRRSCSKSFTVGEPVLVLQKDTTSSKVFSTWIGPAVVVEVQSPNSYVIEFDDGSRRIIHANHLCKFHVKAQSVTYDTQLLTHDYDECGVNSCALINDDDTDFGEIHAFESIANDKSLHQNCPVNLLIVAVWHTCHQNSSLNYYRYSINMLLVFPTPLV